MLSDVSRSADVGLWAQVGRPRRIYQEQVYMNSWWPEEGHAAPFSTGVSSGRLCTMGRARIHTIQELRVCAILGPSDWPGLPDKS